MADQKKKPAIWIWRSYPEPDPAKDTPEIFINEIKQTFDIVWYGDIKENPERGKSVQGAMSIYFNYKVFLEQKEHMPNCKILTNVGVGCDHIQVDSHAREGIIVANTPDVQSGAVAEQAMALMLSAARAILPSTHWMRSKGTLHINLLGQEVTGATLGIVGLGSIGFKTAQRAMGFNMKILYHQRSRKSKEEEATLGGAEYYGRLHQMLPHCDFVVIACPLTMATENLFRAKEFSLMKPTAILVNVARGQIVNHDDLVVALDSGQIHGAALDVTWPEPLPLKHPLLRMENVIVTPHAGTATYGTRRAMFQACVDNLKAFLIDDTSPPNLVKPSYVQ